MIWRILLFLALYLAVELVLLAWIVSETSFLFTLLLMVGTALVGVHFARQQRLRVLLRIQEQATRGLNPTTAMLEGVCVLIAGVALILPGILSDALGLLLLIPVTRRAIVAGAAQYFRHRSNPTFRHRSAPFRRHPAQAPAPENLDDPFHRDAIIDVEVMDN